MKTLNSPLLGLLMVFSLHAFAQNASPDPATSQSTPVDGGAIIMPPVQKQNGTTQEPIRKQQNSGDRPTGEPPHHQGVSPGKAAIHGQQQTEPAARKSLDDSCKGRPELCKQDSAR